MRRLFLVFTAAALAAANIRIAPDDRIHVFFSSASGDRLTRKPELTFGAARSGLEPVVAVDPSKRFQQIDGFGATFTEAGLMVLNRLPAARQEEVLRSLFDPKAGAGFTLMKSPLAAFDFSSAGTWHSYAETPGDLELKDFSIARDLEPHGLVTFIRRARKYGKFSIQSTMDYPPDWMLDEKMGLKPEFYDVCARYMIRYLEAYRAAGVEIAYLSPFNEPEHVYCRITYDQIRDFIKDHLGPRLLASGLGTRLQTPDAHNRLAGLRNLPKLLDHPEVRKHIAVISLHGYSWDEQGSAPAGELRARYPGLRIWQSEVCHARVIDYRPMPVYGFEDGDRWGRMIVADMNNGVSGWIYWNMILDQNGGPWLVSPKHNNPKHNGQHPVVIIDTAKRTVNYTGLYYYLAHFSRFVRPGATRIGVSGHIAGVHAVAFENPDGQKVLNVINAWAQTLPFRISDGRRTALASLPARSIGTFVWGPSSVTAVD